ncbi:MULTISPECIES: ArsR/SmtB family transcription factor [Thalassospira]|uniref:ArsR family transcriptional regulator n=2 Tax=Thalassospira TaxID=168934 RepID=A0A367VZ59_9PROT|nr:MULTISPECIES: metalloregulator ArsR/SmtB family transcription factor [Thalassospira]MDG4721705.1 metalloregulator ArsR/SmtB family transcription factor [Thalassospira sp. FZY0004]RCK31694.1 ArsR family transcriptional regulator [Thalassospira profundimaris]
MDKYEASLDTLFHALADPTRRAVVQRLVKGPAPVKELATPYDMALPSFMKHLNVLEQAGLIASEKQGRVRTCSFNPDKLETAEKWFDEQRALWASRFDNLDNLLTSLQGGNDET